MPHAHRSRPLAGAGRALTAAIAAIAVAALTGAASAQAVADSRLEAVIADEARGDAMARDKYRKPYDVLSFFGIEPDMTVVEIWPGGGWYMDILAPYLAEDGYYIATAYDPGADNSYMQRALEKHYAKLADNRGRYGFVTTTALSGETLKVAPPNSVDMILTFRNLHNWMGRGFADDAAAAFFTALKPGATLGVVEHRLPEDREQDPRAESGYVKQSHTVALFEKAGFELVESAEILANPKDTADYEKGVWTLPPTLRTANKECGGAAYNQPPEDQPELSCPDQSRFLEIGESDRMVLKFIKPAR